MKKIFIIIFIICMVFIIFISFFFIFSKEKDINNLAYFDAIDLKTNIKDTNLNNKIDISKYEDKIIKDNLYSVEYTFFDENKSLKGLIYIGENKNLYIKDDITNVSKKISSINFKTMYTKDIEYDSGIYVYLISEDNDLYSLSFVSTNLEELKINKINLDYKVLNFVDVNFDYDITGPFNSLFVLADDGNIYDVSSNIIYSENIKSLYYDLYVLNNNIMTNKYGDILMNKNKEYYKIKNIFETYEDNYFSGKNTKIIITEDNKLLYFDSMFLKINEYSLNVKKVDFDTYYPYVKGNLKIIFQDDSFVEFKASCNQFFCINDFVE